MKKLLKVTTVSAFLLGLPSLMFAQNGGSGANSGLNPGQFAETAGTITQYINIAIGLIIGIAVLVFIFGLIKYVTAGGDPEQLKAARNTIIMGIVVIAVMITVWGLIKFVVSVSGLNTQAIDNSLIPKAPTPSAQ